MRPREYEIHEILQNGSKWIRRKHWTPARGTYHYRHSFACSLSRLYGICLMILTRTVLLDCPGLRNLLLGSKALGPLVQQE